MRNAVSADERAARSRLVGIVCVTLMVGLGVGGVLACVGSSYRPTESAGEQGSPTGGGGEGAAAKPVTASFPDTPVERPTKVNPNEPNEDKEVYRKRLQKLLPAWDVQLFILRPYEPFTQWASGSVGIDDKPYFFSVWHDRKDTWSVLVDDKTTDRSARSLATFTFHEDGTQTSPNPPAVARLLEPRVRELVEAFKKVVPYR